MTDRPPDAFTAALAGDAPPPGWSAPLAALWWLARGPERDEPAWERAHALVQDAPGRDAAWVHAHLHRIEGDTGNAGYWYDRAGRRAAASPLAEERATIAAALLGEAGDLPTTDAEP